MEKSHTQRQTEKQKSNPLWIGLSLFIILGIILLKIPCPSNAQFIFLRIGISLAAGSSAYVLGGYIKYRTKEISASGGFAIFIIVLFSIPHVIPPGENCHESFSFKVLLRDSLGMPGRKEDSFLSMTVEGHEDKRKIQDDGTVTFEQIPRLFKDSPVQMTLYMDGWVFSNKKHFKEIQLQSSYVRLFIEPDDSRCCVVGTVRDTKNRYIVGITIRIGDQTTLTDNNGRFRLEVPRNKQSDLYSIQFEKDGVIYLEKSVNPRSTQENVFIVNNLKTS